MSVPTRPVSRYQRRILVWGVGVTCLLYVIGAPIYLDAVETDLTDRVSADLAAAGFDGVTVTFSGQTGSFSCEAPLDDPRGAVDVAYEVRGVRSIEALPEECRVLLVPPEEEPTDGTTAVTTTTVESTTTTEMAQPDFESVLAVLSGNPQFSLLARLFADAGLTDELTTDGRITLFAPTDSAFDALSADAVAQLRSDPELLARVLRHHLIGERLTSDQLAVGQLITLADDMVMVTADDTSLRVDGATIVEPDILAMNGVVHGIDELLLPDDVDLTTPARLAPVSATFDTGAYSLQGVVRSEVERSVLVAAATGAVGAAGTTDELIVDADLGIAEETAQRLAALIAAIPANLVSGTAAFDGEMLTVSGVYVDQSRLDAITAIADSVDAGTELTPRPAPTESDAAQLETELNAFVTQNPIQFEPGQAVLDETAQPILDEIARRVLVFPGVTLTVEGHTDSDGDAQRNLELSQERADVVRQALVDRGLDPASSFAEGFGSSQPVLVDGVEDKAASRRVEFRVAAG